MISNQEFGLMLEALFSNKEFQGKHFAKRSREMVFFFFFAKSSCEAFELRDSKTRRAEKEIMSSMSML